MDDSSRVCIGQAPEITEAEAIRKAVATRMDSLDEAFLIALGAYVGAAEEQGDRALAGIICSGTPQNKCHKYVDLRRLLSAMIPCATRL